MALITPFYLPMAELTLAIQPDPWGYSTRIVIEYCALGVVFAIMSMVRRYCRRWPGSSIVHRFSVFPRRRQCCGDISLDARD